MARFSLPAFNRDLAARGVELVKGAGYFYLADLGDSTRCAGMRSASVMVCHFNHLNESQWRAAVDSLLSP